MKFIWNLFMWKRLAGNFSQIAKEIPILKKDFFKLSPHKLIGSCFPTAL